MILGIRKSTILLLLLGATSTNSFSAVAPPTKATKPTGTSFLPPETIERAKKGSPVEKAKLAKDGTSAFVDVYEYARKIREGEMTWEEVEKADLETRLKWVGMLHRGKRTPGQFMMRLKVPNGIINADQLRFYAESVEPYGPEVGVVDITTRANIQLRGVKIEDAPAILDGLHARNQTSFQSALDNVRNMVGSPLAGIDDCELVDTREFCNALNDLVSLDPVTGTRGNPYWGNLPRKFNIAISGSRDDFAHTHINDIGLVPTPHATTGEMGFNVVLGGYMSIKRVAESIPGNMWIKADRNSVVTFCEAILRIFRDEAERKDRTQARLMWLVEKYGVEDYKKAVIKEVESYGRGVVVEDAQPALTGDFERRELLGVHKQPQEGKVRVGILVPAGRLSVDECRQVADLADKYSNGEIRLTVEQNIILPNVDEGMVDELQKEPALKNTRLVVNPGFIEGNLVSCTGAQFCGLALIETKANAESIVKKLEKEVKIDRPIRIHFTGCPNSCGQVQVADIGIMGAPARKEDDDGKMKAVPGCKIFVGGRIGEDAHLALDPYVEGIPLDEEDLIPVLVDILEKEFGAVKKSKIRKFISKLKRK
jgi:ferredoxin-nitrite reductase